MDRDCLEDSKIRVDNKHLLNQLDFDSKDNVDIDPFQKLKQFALELVVDVQLTGSVQSYLFLLYRAGSHRFRRC